LEDEFTAVCVNKADLQGNWYVFHILSFKGGKNKEILILGLTGLFIMWFRNLVLPKEKEKARGKDSKEYDEDSDYYIEDEDDDDDDDEDNVLPDTNFDTEVSRPAPKVPIYKK